MVLMQDAVESPTNTQEPDGTQEERMNQAKSDPLPSLKLVVKHTFLEFERPQATEEIDRPTRRTRAFTDTAIEYNSDMKDQSGSSDVETESGLADCPDSSGWSPVDASPRSNEGHWSQATSDDDSSSEAQQGHTGAAHGSTAAEQTCERQSSMNEVQSLHGAPQHYYYIPVAGNPFWSAQIQQATAAAQQPSSGQGAAAGNLMYAGCQQQTLLPSSTTTLEARARGLEIAAAQLKAAARQAKVAAAHYSSDPWMAQQQTNWGSPSSASSPSAQKQNQKQNQKRSATGAGPDSRKSGSRRENAERTTLMLRNIPNDYTRSMLLEMLDREGFAAKYDFVYLPIDFHRFASLGYAFVNCVTGADAENMKEHFQGFIQWKVSSQKVCDVCWGDPLQGLLAHIDRYRNSPVMHEEVPDEYKPVLLMGGVRSPFPAATKRIRPPRVKRGHIMHVNHAVDVQATHLD